ncbi:MAG: NAD-dependent DNA ligase LigA [Clostridia bacterium]|nr:NAD-dependent DNA ligase LigA [Clostridia bacterium]
MNKDNQSQIVEMKQLIEKINKASYDYYVLDNPTISDKEWDSLYYKLLDLEKETGIVLENSPSKKVGGEVLDGFKKITHERKLYSLGKAQTITEIEDWNIRNQNIFSFNPEFSVEYKFDGLSLSLSYNKGSLIQAATRGNGEIGEDVTEQVKTIRTVPLTIPYLGRIDIQGEGIIKLSELEKYNSKTDEKLKNARNAVAGAIRNLDPKETAKRNLDFFAYNINFSPNKSFASQEEICKFLKEQGFLVGNFFKKVNSIEEIEKIINEVNKSRNKLDFLIDGLVIKINNESIRDRLGFTEKVPRWAIAYKFEAEETSTILNSITWQVGRTGKITPVAELEPVELCGVTIKRATLNNFNDINRKGVKIGDRVFIRRSNDVIPEILSVAESFETSTPIEKPKTCPCCGAILEDTETELYCPNHLGCKAQIVLKLTQFASRNAMNIDGLSIKTFEALYDTFQTKTFSDIYKLTTHELSTLEGFKDKKINNVLSSIEKSKNVKLSNFIFALGIGNIGIKTAKQLAKHYKSIQNLSKSQIDELIELDDIAEITATEIHHYFTEEFNRVEIDELLKFITIEPEQEVNANGFFAGKKVVLTGTLASFSRDKASEIIESQGGKTIGSVSASTDIVLVGENPGSKFDKAKKLGIRIMFEDEFKSLI